MSFSQGDRMATSRATRRENTLNDFDCLFPQGMANVVTQACMWLLAYCTSHSCDCHGPPPLMPCPCCSICCEDPVLTLCHHPDTHSPYINLI